MNLFALIAVAIAAVTMSFNLANTTYTWHFTGTTEFEGDYADIANWELGYASENTCVEIGTKPCEIEVRTDDEEVLEVMLNGLSNEQVLDINPGSSRF